MACKRVRRHVFETRPIVRHGVAALRLGPRLRRPGLCELMLKGGDLGRGRTLLLEGSEPLLEHFGPLPRAEQGDEASCTGVYGSFVWLP